RATSGLYHDVSCTNATDHDTGHARLVRSDCHVKENARTGKREGRPGLSTGRFACTLVGPHTYESKPVVMIMTPAMYTSMARNESYPIRKMVFLNRIDRPII